MRDLAGKTVAITGASAGVGRAIAHRFARAGADIGLIARDRGALEDVRHEIERLGGRAVVVPADVADAESVFVAADEIEREFGSIDIWINDAMVTVFSPIWEITPEEFARVTDVTYLGFVHGTMAALRHMRPRNRGTVIQIGSGLAYRGIPLQSAYCGAKHAIRGFTNSVRAELIHEGSAIRMTMMELPAVNTPQFDWARTHMPRQPRPVAPVVQPEAIANAVFHAALRPGREYWIGRTTVELILGNMIMPEFFDRLLARTTVSGQQTRRPVLAGRRDNMMAPVHDLHRTRGSFDDEASGRAAVVSGPVARLAPVLSASFALLALGALAHRIGTRTRERQRAGRSLNLPG